MSEFLSQPFEVAEVSTGPTTIPNQSPVPAKPVDWLHIILGLAATVFGTIQGMQIVKPTPVPIPQPQPGPVVIVEPPAPQPKPGPVPVDPPAPPPKPVPTPTDPTSILSMKYFNGEKLASVADTGRMFTVTAPSGVSLYAQDLPSDDADVDEVSSNKLRVVLRNEYTLRIVVIGVGRPFDVSIQCNHGPQPPPVPTPIVVPPTPVPTPVPTPLPVPQPVPITNSGPVSIGIIEDAGNRPLPMASILSNHSLWDKYRAAGHKVRVWNAGSNPSTESEAVSDIASMKVAGISQPGIVVRNQTGGLLYVGKMPTIPTDVSTTLRPFTGVAP